MRPHNPHEVGVLREAPPPAPVRNTLALRPRGINSLLPTYEVNATHRVGKLSPFEMTLWQQQFMVTDERASFLCVKSNEEQRDQCRIGKARPASAFRTPDFRIGNALPFARTKIHFRCPERAADTLTLNDNINRSPK